MSSPDILVPPRQRIARAFGLKAKTYGDRAIIQSELIGRLVARLAKSVLPGGKWVDLGCGTGIFAGECRKTGILHRITGLDIAFDPLVVYNKKYPGPSPSIQADIRSLPFKKEVFDGAVTASTLQWLGNDSDTMRNIAAILKPGTGILAFSVFVKGSFRELFSVQQQFGIPAPVLCFEAGEFVRMLEGAGFEAIDYDMVHKTVYAPAAALLLKSISAIGGTATAGKLLNRKELSEFCRAYESRFRTGDGIPLTYRTVIGACRKGPRP
jgi:malonyl-CoA O-methyltransferase